MTTLLTSKSVIQIVVTSVVSSFAQGRQLTVIIIDEQSRELTPAQPLLSS